MQPMEVLQPGLPSSTAIPLDCLCILDLKDVFLFYLFIYFAIPLHSKGREKFAFTL
jgi:hypothetical protein